VLYALTDDTIITYQELYQAITKKQPESIEVYRIKSADTAPRTVATHRHGVPFASSRANCGKTGFAVWGGVFCKSYLG
ncbi:hypothetical protein ACVAOM_004430, partial [Salmonella enterica subsp. enterica serovar Chester]